MISWHLEKRKIQKSIARVQNDFSLLDGDSTAKIVFSWINKSETAWRLIDSTIASYEE